MSENTKVRWPIPIHLTILLVVLVVYLGTSPLVWRLSTDHSPFHGEVSAAPGVIVFVQSGDIAQPADWARNLYFPITLFRGNSLSNDLINELYPGAIITDSIGNHY